MRTKTNYEHCYKDLLPAPAQAHICTYECAFCSHCVKNALYNVCPNCGGGFSKRPIRPRTERRPGVSLEHQHASDKHVHTKYFD
ncbi:MAG: DUF1272 domain-containing protein [Gammaproteobacteria bacterium]|nr:DUF1272 domain-containing protein [Gammaproteobacteria bacterium]